MKLLETILAEHSKTQTERIIKWVGNDQKRFDKLYKIFLHGNPVAIQRAGWPLGYIAEFHPQLIKKHLGSLITNLERPGLHNAVQRNTLRILQFVSIPRRLHGRVLNLCFNFITDPGERPAIKASALTVLHNLSSQYPDIRNELRLVIETQWENESPAFRARAKKILGQH
jgi:hypothetical protein